MTLARDVAVTGMIAGYEEFGRLIQDLTDEQWKQPTRCEGWTVADVAAHVVGQLSDIVNFRLEGIGSPEVTQRQVDERRGRTPAELTEELLASQKLGTDIVNSFDDEAWNGPAPGGLPGTIGSGIEALWADAYVHGDDIRAAAGLPSVGGDGQLASVSHLADALTERGWGPATIALEGLPEFAVSGGGGQRITGEPLPFILAATGRADPASIGLDPTVNIYG